MSYQDKLDAARRIIDEHNQAMGFSQPPAEDQPSQGFLDPEKFFLNLKMAGGTNEERLGGFSYEDLIGCMLHMDTGGIKPVGLAKDLARIFRGKDESKPTPPYISERLVGRMQPAQLVAVFDPEEPDNPVGKRLRELSRGEPFLVYSSGRTVDQANSLKVLLEIKKGFSGRDTLQVAPGDVRPVYRVGDLPDDLVDENPIYRGRPLRPDGTCDQTNRSWDGVSLNVRQLVRLIVERRGSVDLDTAHNLIDTAVGSSPEGAWSKLSARHQDAAAKFKQLEAAGSLPRLRVPIKSSPGGRGDILTQGRRVR